MSCLDDDDLGPHQWGRIEVPSRVVVVVDAASFEALRNGSLSWGEASDRCLAMAFGVAGTAVDVSADELVNETLDAVDWHDDGATLLTDVEATALVLNAVESG